MQLCHDPDVNGRLLTATREAPWHAHPLVTAPRNPLAIDPDHEQRVRERAYHLWEAEGKPHGRDVEYWERARELIGMEESAGGGLLPNPLTAPQRSPRNRHRGSLYPGKPRRVSRTASPIRARSSRPRRPANARARQAEETGLKARLHPNTPAR